MVQVVCGARIIHVGGSYIFELGTTELRCE